jgi:hypothetical protein
MSDDLLAVVPGDLRGTAKNLNTVSARMSAVLSNLQHLLDAEGTPWGNDDTGKQFAEGDSGYLAQLAYVKSAIGDKTDLLSGYATDLTTTANGLEQQDQG